MATAHCIYKDLCLDVSAPEPMSRFWSAALGLSAELRGDSYVLVDDLPEHTVWLNGVPEPKTTKHRVHLDVHVAEVADLTRLGAAVVDESQPWTVLTDPEGGELCAFVRTPDRLPRHRLYEVVVDSADPERIAHWWAERFGSVASTEDGADFWWISGGTGPPWEVVFGEVPEPKTVKNRVHWDVWGDTSDLVSADARLLSSPGDQLGWDVLADPEGNEFCVFTRS